MNKGLHKIIFSKRLGALVAVAETSMGAGKSSAKSIGVSGGSIGIRFGLSLLVALLFGTECYAATIAANTLPTGATVAQGKVSVSQTANTMTITQSSDKAVVNFQSFNVGSNAKVNIIQPSANSVQLDRVTGNDPSKIMGQLTSNGQVVLVNPNGIVVGKDGSVSASAFTASTLGISDADFMAGNYNYKGNGSNGAVVNHGTIKTANGNYVALLGAKVTNDGKIDAGSGSAYLGAANTISVPVSRSGRIKLEVSADAINAAVSNTNNGVIQAAGGQVYIQAGALNDAAAIAISGTVDVSGKQGGNVTILADGGQIAVHGSVKANSTASTTATGGNIVIGRDTDTGVLAKSTDVSGANLQAANGFVETSAHVVKSDGVQVKASTWLIDPNNVEINDTGIAAVAGDTVVTTKTIEDAVNSGAQVIISTGVGANSTASVTIIPAAGTQSATTTTATPTSGSSGSSGSGSAVGTGASSVAGSSSTGNTASGSALGASTSTTNSSTGTAAGTTVTGAAVATPSSGSSTGASAGASSGTTAGATPTASASGSTSAKASASGSTVTTTGSTTVASSSGSGASGVSTASSSAGSGGAATPASSSTAPATINQTATASSAAMNTAGAVQAVGNISINANLSKIAGASTSIKFIAANDVSLGAGKSIASTSGALNVVFNADSGGVGSGAVVLNPGSGISTNGGNIALGGGVAGTGAGAASANGANVNGVNINGASLNSGSGNISINGTSSTATGSGVSIQGGSVISAGGGNVTVKGNNTGSSNSGVLVDKTSSIVTPGGVVAITAPAINIAGSIDVSSGQAGSVSVVADGGSIVVSGSIKANSSNVGSTGGNIVIGRDADNGEVAATTDVSGAVLQSSAGTVETSGAYLASAGVRVRANNWLLDPTNLEINDSSTALIAGDSVVNTSDLSYGLAHQWGQLTLSATGNIYVNGHVTEGGYDGYYESILNLVAGGNITFGAGSSVAFGLGSSLCLTSTGSGNIDWSKSNGITVNGNDIVSIIGVTHPLIAVSTAGGSVIGGSFNSGSLSIDTSGGSTVLARNGWGVIVPGSSAPGDVTLTGGTSGGLTIYGGNVQLTGVYVGSADPSVLPSSGGSIAGLGYTGHVIQGTNGVSWNGTFVSSYADNFTLIAGDGTAASTAALNVSNGSSIQTNGGSVNLLTTGTGNINLGATNLTTGSSGNVSVAAGTALAAGTTDGAIAGLNNVIFSTAKVLLYAGSASTTDVSSVTGSLCLANCGYTQNAVLNTTYGDTTTGTGNSINGGSSVQALFRDNTPVAFSVDLSKDMSTSRVYDGVTGGGQALTTSGLEAGYTGGDVTSTVGNNTFRMASNTAIGGLTGVATATVSNNTNVGTYSYTGISGWTDGSQTVSATAPTVTITPATLTVTGNSTPLTYNGGVQTNTYTVSGLKANDSVSSVGLAVSGMATATHVSDGTVNDNLASSITSGNYTVSLVNGSLTIIPAALTVTGNSGSLTYNGSAQTNGYTVSGLQGSDTATSVGLNVSGSAVSTNVSQGTVADKLNTSVTSGDYTVSSINGTLTITPRTLTVTGDVSSAAYTGAVQTNTYKVSGLATSDTSTSVGLAVSGMATATHVSQGTVADKLSGSVTSSNYSVAMVNGSLTITPVTLTVDGNSNTTQFSGSAVTGTYKTSGLVGTDSASSIGLKVSGLASGTDPGTYYGKLVASSSSKDYVVTTGKGGSITITPADNGAITPVTPSTPSTPSTPASGGGSNNNNNSNGSGTVTPAAVVNTGIDSLIAMSGRGGASDGDGKGGRGLDGILVSSKDSAFIGWTTAFKSSGDFGLAGLECSVEQLLNDIDDSCDVEWVNGVRVYKNKVEQ